MLSDTESEFINQVDADVWFSAVSPREQNRIYTGIPFGGVALLWHKFDMDEMVSIDSGRNRIAEKVISNGSKRLLIITVYMPCLVIN